MSLCFKWYKQYLILDGYYLLRDVHPYWPVCPANQHFKCNIAYKSIVNVKTLLYCRVVTKLTWRLDNHCLVLKVCAPIMRSAITPILYWSPQMLESHFISCTRIWTHVNAVIFYKLQLINKHFALCRLSDVINSCISLSLFFVRHKVTEHSPESGRCCAEFWPPPNYYPPLALVGLGLVVGEGLGLWG